MKTTILKENPMHEWARVELYRWQHNCLPLPESNKPSSEAVGLREMARGIEMGCKARDHSLMPTPENVCIVLKYIADKLEGKAR